MHQLLGDEVALRRASSRGRPPPPPTPTPSTPTPPPPHRRTRSSSTPTRSGSTRRVERACVGGGARPRRPAPLAVRGQRVLLGIDRVDYIKGARAAASSACLPPLHLSRTPLPHPSLLDRSRTRSSHSSSPSSTRSTSARSSSSRSPCPRAPRSPYRAATAHCLVATVNGRFGRRRTCRSTTGSGVDLTRWSRCTLGTRLDGAADTRAAALSPLSALSLYYSTPSPPSHRDLLRDGMNLSRRVRRLPAAGGAAAPAARPPSPPPAAPPAAASPVFVLSEFTGGGAGARRRLRPRQPHDTDASRGRCTRPGDGRRPAGSCTPTRDRTSPSTRRRRGHSSSLSYATTAPSPRRRTRRPSDSPTWHARTNSSRRLLVIGVGGGAYLRRGGADAGVLSDAPPDVVGTEVSDPPAAAARPRQRCSDVVDLAREDGRAADSPEGADDGGAPAASCGRWRRMALRGGDGGWEATVQAAQEQLDEAHEVCHYASARPSPCSRCGANDTRGYAAAAADLAGRPASGPRTFGKGARVGAGRGDSRGCVGCGRTARRWGTACCSLAADFKQNNLSNAERRRRRVALRFRPRARQLYGTDEEVHRCTL